jgi:phospholipase/carboxylesterase
VAVNPHLAAPVVCAGPPLAEAAVAVVALHGRDQDPEYMLEHLVAPLGAADVAWVLPAAAGRSWYPDRFHAPRASNEPAFGAALAACEAMIERVAAAGVPARRTVLAGFSQGACLLADFVARAPRPYAGVAILTGALCGPPGDVTPVAALDGLEVLLASSRHDEWVPLHHVEATARAFAAAGADVTLRVSDDREHRIGEEAVAGVEALLARARAGG